MMEKRLPEGWEWTKLSKICEKPQYGYTTRAKHDGIPPQLLRTTDISKGVINWGSVPFCSEPPIDEERYLLKEGDILIARAGSVGASIVVRNPPESIFASYLIRFRPKENLNPRYAGFFLRSNMFWAQLGSKTAGTTLPGVNATNLSNVKIPLPPLETQHMIVTILEKAEETNRLRMQADELTSQLLQSVFLEMFGDPVKNPKGWETEKLGVNCSFITSGSRGWAKFYSSEGAKFIRVQNLTRHRLSFDDIAFVSPPDTAEAKRTKVKPDDLLISITGVVGLVAVAPEDIGDAYVSQHVAIVRLRERTDPSFLASFLAHPTGGQFQIMNRQYGQTKPGIGLDDIRSIRIFIPPISLQQKFVQVVEKIEAMQQTQKQSQQEIDNLFNALMQKAFKGELVA